MLSATSSYSASGGEEEEEEEDKERKEKTEKDKEEKRLFDLTQVSTVLRNEIIPSIDKIMGKKLKKGLGPLKKEIVECKNGQAELRKDMKRIQEWTENEIAQLKESGGESLEVFKEKVRQRTRLFLGLSLDRRELKEGLKEFLIRAAQIRKPVERGDRFEEAAAQAERLEKGASSITNRKHKRWGNTTMVTFARKRDTQDADSLFSENQTLEMEVRKHIRCIMPRTEEEQRKAVVKWATITLQDEEKTEEEKKEAKEALQRVGEKVPGEEREEQTGRGAKRERVQTLQSKDRPRERRCGKRGGGGGCRHAGNEEGGEGKDRPPPKDRKGHTEEEERRKRIELMGPEYK
eukprot:Cvel_119.t1-p1 / transcript=Cvel_119.t1 / gene=Cvel_119 / organism=Chromera_velia_CCMP2878 / gene_product=hypothetical protein / transcript_product=hypothetical protein / location=Cvel_scaffold8:222545-223585(+) / protein_length=347 / sequence_SO=supercontig / SO=protein_coding / is_pseudo=false